MGRSWTFGQKLGLGLAVKAILTLVLSVVAIYAHAVRHRRQGRGDHQERADR